MSKQTILKRMKADDPDESRRTMGQSRRSRSKADDLWVKADALLSQSRRSTGQSRRSTSQSRRSRVKADDHLCQSRRSLGSKQTILLEIELKYWRNTEFTERIPDYVRKQNMLGIHGPCAGPRPRKNSGRDSRTSAGPRPKTKC